MKKILAFGVGVVLFVVILITAVSTNEYRKENGRQGSRTDQEKLITIGFSQVGAESNWRTANSISIKQTFTPERGYDLLFEDAKQKQSNQIMAIRRFIQQEVDYIVFSPVVETGWDTVLEEAKRAGIPVIVIDRRVSVEDSELVYDMDWFRFLSGGTEGVQDFVRVCGAKSDSGGQYCTYARNR